MKKVSDEELEIRDMTIDDYEEVVKIWKKAGIHLGFSDTKPEIKRMLDHNPGLCLVLLNKQKNQIIGAVLGGFDGRRGWIHHLAVDPEYQKQGLGKMIMEELTKRFKERRIAKLKLEVLKENAGVIKFYKKLGWILRDEIITMSLTLIAD